MKPIDIIATLNHHLLEPSMLKDLKAAGATIFRINGAHAKPEEIPHYVSAIRKALGNEIKILVDLPGNKIRTNSLSQPIILNAGKPFDLWSTQINYPGFISHLSVGDELLANDSLFRFRVLSVEKDKVTFLSMTDGQLGSNKGMHLIGKSIDLPFLFERDQELIKQGISTGIDYVGFSFVRTAEDVKTANEVLKNTQVKMIIKVETNPAVKNLSSILDLADEFLVDRGDLGCDVGIENIDRIQKYILKSAQRKGKKVFFATQFLHSMVYNNTPLIAEVCGLADALRVGIGGLQLSEETAVGKHPVEVLKMIERVRKSVSDEAKLKPRKDPTTGIVLWLTGRSGSGKTTISKILEPMTDSRLLKSCLIDGDEFRAFFDNQAGYSKEERLRNLQNIAFTAFQAAKVFDLVIVSSLSPYQSSRDFARKKIANFHEIYIDCDQKICQERDPKGNYKKALEGKMESYVGVTEEYEVPKSPDLHINTEKQSPEQAAETILSYLLGSDLP